MKDKIQEMRESVINYIPKLKDGIMEASEFFQKYEENKGTALLVQITEGIKWIIDAVVAIKELKEEKVVEVNNKLNEIVDALENEDYILVGDLLQYELLPEIEEIENNLIY